MTQDHKYWGMTSKQLGILAGLAALACLIFGVTGGLALRDGLGLFSRSSESTLAAQPTATLLVLPTATSTVAPTPIPYEQLIPFGWMHHKTQLMELWTPPDFKSAAPWLVSGVAGEAVYLNLALISAVDRSGYPATVSVSYEPLTSASLDAFLETKLSNIPPDVNMAENRNVSINSAEAVRILFERKTENNLDVNDLLFVLEDGGIVWYIKYSAEIKEFYELLPYFEESVKTFRVVK